MIGIGLLVLCICALYILLNMVKYQRIVNSIQCAVHSFEFPLSPIMAVGISQAIERYSTPGDFLESCLILLV